MNRVLVIGVIVLFIASSVIPISGFNIEHSSISASSGNTLYVGGSGEGNYTRIQDAIDNASDGDTVFVYNGTYVENLVVNKSISLIGEDRNTTRIDSSGIDVWEAICILADWVNICGFTILKNETGEIDTYADHVTISNNNIEKIQLRVRGNKNLISDNKISGYGTGYCGVELWRGHNMLSDNIISGWELGIFQIGQGTNVTISGNVISNNSRMGIWVHHKLYNSEISENVIEDNEYGLNMGISKYNLISGNIFRSNNVALDIAESSSNKISNNTFKNNYNGIILILSIFNKITSNNFINNNRNAIFGLFSLYNNWNKNYWGRPRLLPKPIIGRIGIFLPWVNFDWRPALKPYDIGV